MMEAVEAKGRISQLLWTRSAGFHYAYHYDGVPWHHPRLAWDLELPPHWQDLMDRERDALEPYRVSDGTTTLTLFPVIDSVIVDRHPAQDEFGVIVGWYDNPEGAGTPVHVTSYRPTLADDLMTAHRDHTAAHEARIRPTLAATHTRTPHALGHGPTKPER